MDSTTSIQKKFPICHIGREETTRLLYSVRILGFVLLIVKCLIYYILSEPRVFSLNILAVAGTDPANVTGEVVSVKTFEELDSINISGKIVLINPAWKGYFGTVQFRRAADRVEKAGGIGLMVRSIGPFSIGSPHTGSGAASKFYPLNIL